VSIILTVVTVKTTGRRRMKNEIPMKRNGEQSRMTKKKFDEVDAEFREYLRTVDPLVDEDAKYIRVHSRFSPATTNEFEMFNAGKKIGFKRGEKSAHARWWTPEEWEDEHGEPYPEEGEVWIRITPDVDWAFDIFHCAKRSAKDGGEILCGNPLPPPKDWGRQ